MSRNPILWAAVALLAFLAAANSMFIVDQRQLAVRLTFGELQAGEYGPGLHFKFPLADDIYRFDGRILSLDNKTPERFLTLEKKNVEVDYFVKWRIADAATYYRRTRGQELAAADLLGSNINRALRDQFGSRTIQQAVAGEEGASGRATISNEVQKAVAPTVKELGIEIKDVRIKSINLPREVSEAVYDRMRTERKRVADELRAKGAEEAEKIKAEADRQAQTLLAEAYRQAEQLKGEGDARAAEIYARAYGADAEFYSFYRTLNVYRDSFAGSKDVLVLEPKGRLFRYFNGDGAK